MSQTDDAALRKICPGTSRWRALSEADAARCVELHRGHLPGSAGLNSLQAFRHLAEEQAGEED